MMNETMFCPKCGKSDQQINSYCRSCGTFLPDFDNLKKRETTPEEHLTANTVLNFMTAGTSLVLAILTASFFWGKTGTPPLIYVVNGFLFAIVAWQVQIIIRTFMLKKQLKKRAAPERKESKQSEETAEPNSGSPLFKAAETRELLNEPNLKDHIPASVVENTTRKLKTKINGER